MVKTSSCILFCIETKTSECKINKYKYSFDHLDAFCFNTENNILKVLSICTSKRNFSMIPFSNLSARNRTQWFHDQ